MRIATRVRVLVIGQVLLLPPLLAGCNSDGRTLRPARPDQTASVYTTTTSSIVATTTVDGAAFDAPTLAAPTVDVANEVFLLNLPWAEGAPIDARYTCDGDDIQPGFTWLGPPEGTVEMALVVRDLDAGNFVHWAIAGLDPSEPFVAENSVPVGAIEATNDFPADPGSSGDDGEPSNVGWRGPCPPPGSSHTYRFTLYALSAPIELPTGTSAADLQAVIDATSLEVAERTGAYPGT